MRIPGSLAAAALLLSTAIYSAPASAGGGDALLGGVFGFAAGTLFGQATARPRYYYYEPAPVYRAAPPPPVVYSYPPEPWTPQWYHYCRARYASFDDRTGLFYGFDGRYHFCR